MYEFGGSLLLQHGPPALPNTFLQLTAGYLGVCSLGQIPHATRGRHLILSSWFCRGSSLVSLIQSTLYTSVKVATLPKTPLSLAACGRSSWGTRKSTELALRDALSGTGGIVVSERRCCRYLRGHFVACPFERPSSSELCLFLLCHNRNATRRQIQYGLN